MCMNITEQKGIGNSHFGWQNDNQLRKHGPKLNMNF